jgi:membrane protein
LTTRDAVRRALRFVRRLVDGMRTHGGFDAAAAIAFWFFLSLVPLLVLLGYLVGQVARSRGVDALITPLLDVVPATAEDIVRQELERLAGTTASLAPVGVIGFLWTASSGLHNLMDVFEAAAKVKPRPWWKQRVIALVWVALGLATAVGLALVLVNVDSLMHPFEAGPATGVSATATPIAPSSVTPPPSSAAPSGTASARPDKVQQPAHAQHAAGRVRGALKRRVSKALHTPAEQALAAVLMLLLGVLFLAGFYRFAVEHKEGVRRRVWPGTLTAVGSWLVVSWGFGIYVVSMSKYAFYYGSLAAVAVMLMWLYLTSLSLVAGAEVNAQLEGVRGSG